MGDMVTKQTRIIFGSEDIVGVRIRCKRCNGETLQTLEDNTAMPDKCNICGRDWQRNIERTFAVRELLSLMREIVRQDSEATLSVLLELDGKSVES